MTRSHHVRRRAARHVGPTGQPPAPLSGRLEQELNPHGLRLVSWRRTAPRVMEVVFRDTDSSYWPLEVRLASRVPVSADAFVVAVRAALKARAGRSAHGPRAA